jgi:hypothetical protein
MRSGGKGVPTFSPQFFRLSQEPLDPTTLPAAENGGCPVCPIETKEGHAGCVEQDRLLIEFAVSAVWADNGFALDAICIGEMLGGGRVEEWSLSAEDAHSGPFRNESLATDAMVEDDRQPARPISFVR